MLVLRHTCADLYHVVWAEGKLLLNLDVPIAVGEFQSCGRLQSLSRWLRNV